MQRFLIVVNKGSDGAGATGARPLGDTCGYCRRWLTRRGKDPVFPINALVRQQQRLMILDSQAQADLQTVETKTFRKTDPSGLVNQKMR
jgi:hypothetical protein